MESLNTFELIQAEVDSVKGTYKNPDQLEQAVFKAFQNISKLVSNPALGSHALDLKTLRATQRENDRLTTKLRKAAKALRKVADDFDLETGVDE